NSTYAEKWNEKLEWYKKNEILPFEDGGGENGTLIITQDDAKGGISAQKISEIIEQVFDLKTSTKQIIQIEDLSKVVFELRDILGSQFSILNEQFQEIKKSSKESDIKLETIYKLL